MTSRDLELCLQEIRDAPFSVLCNRLSRDWHGLGLTIPD